MTVTIGSFSTNRLTAQPFGYEGEARTGLTARTFRISGLLTPAEWQTLVSEYNSWRSTRIQDQDTLLSNTVGTTISLTITSTNNLNVSGLSCWFAEPPAGEQLGVYVSATVVMVDAAQALAVLQRERIKQKQRELAETQEAVDCTLISARLTRQRDETACELTALSGGLAASFAAQDVSRESIDKTAQLAARASAANALAALDTQLEIQQKTAQLSTFATYGASNAGLDLDLELARNAAEITALQSRLTALKTSRVLKALYDSFLSEDIPTFGTFQGITLTTPADSRYSDTSIQFTAGGGVLLSGQRASLPAKNVEGYTDAAGASSILSWYDSAIAAGSGWFPTSAPTFRAEHVLVNGAKVVRVYVSFSAVQLPS